MKSGDWVLIMLAFCVTASILITVIGVIFKGKEANEHSVIIRTAVIDLLKIIAGGVIGAISSHL
jgi:hypothetical protein